MTQPTPSRSRRALRVAVAGAVVAVLAGATACGVPLDEEPRAIDRTSTTTTTAAPPVVGGDGETLSAYFFNGDNLEDEQVPTDDDPTVDDAINAVLAGPEGNLTTEIPVNTELLGLTVDGATATIDLSDDIEGFTGPTQKKGYAQLVFTALAVGGIQQVRFKVAGQDVKAPTDQGNLDVVTADDYDAPLNPR